MKKFILLAILIFMLTISAKAETEEIIKKGESLNLARCLEIGLKLQPNIIAALNTADASQHRIAEARANYYPQINWSTGYSRVLPVSTSRLSSSSGSQFFSSSSGGSFDQYSSSFSLSQNIYDFGRTSSQVNIQSLNYNSSLADLETVAEQITFNIKQAYYGVLRARRNRDVSADTVKQFELHLEQAKGFFEVGTKPKFDVTKAEVDLSNARLNLIKAENALRIAVVNLDNAMGVPDAPEYVVEDNLSYQKYEITLDDALSRAYQNRPDMKSIAAKRRAAEVSVDFAKTGYYPAITGNASYGWAGETFPLDHGWTVGATVSVPIFSGFLTKSQVSEAKANLNVLKANEESVRQTIVFDVQQAFLNLREAQDRIPAAELSVRLALENFDIANGRYAAGVGNPIEVTDAEVSLTNAKTAHIQALYDYKSAQASLEKAMGVR